MNSKVSVENNHILSDFAQSWGRYKQKTEEDMAE